MPRKTNEKDVDEEESHDAHDSARGTNADDIGSQDGAEERGPDAGRKEREEEPGTTPEVLGVHAQDKLGPDVEHKVDDAAVEQQRHHEAVHAAMQDRVCVLGTRLDETLRRGSKQLVLLQACKAPADCNRHHEHDELRHNHPERHAPEQLAQLGHTLG